MIKSMLKSLAILGALVAGSTFAGTNAIAGKYYTAPYTKAFNAALVPATNISVLNYSDDTIFAYVPGLTIPLYSGNANTIRLDNFWGDTYLTLQDPRGVPFYTQYVCHRAMVIVDGRPGYYRTTVDRRYC